MGDYTPRVPTPEMVDRAIQSLTPRWPCALERSDFLEGILNAIASIGYIVNDAAQRERPEPAADRVFMAMSQNLGDNFELWRAVKDTLFPADDVEATL